MGGRRRAIDIITCPDVGDSLYKKLQRRTEINISPVQFGSPRVTRLLLSPSLHAYGITRTRDVQCSALAMKTTLTPHLRISPYKFKLSE